MFWSRPSRSYSFARKPPVPLWHRVPVKSAKSRKQAIVSSPYTTQTNRMFKQLLSKIQPGNKNDRHSGPSTTVVLRDEAGSEVSKIDCHEEPNVLGLSDGYGYFPLTLGQSVHEGKLEIVRKLGWGQNSTVWLARTHKLVSIGTASNSTIRLTCGG
jgi:hypothetical protein